jgi:hypothetical protein
LPAVPQFRASAFLLILEFLLLRLQLQPPFTVSPALAATAISPSIAVSRSSTRRFSGLSARMLVEFPVRDGARERPSRLAGANTSLNRSNRSLHVLPSEYLLRSSWSFVMRFFRTVLCGKKGPSLACVQ